MTAELLARRPVRRLVQQFTEGDNGGLTRAIAVGIKKSGQILELGVDW